MTEHRPGTERKQWQTELMEKGVGFSGLDLWGVESDANAVGFCLAERQVGMRQRSRGQTPRSSCPFALAEDESRSR